MLKREEKEGGENREKEVKKPKTAVPAWTPPVDSDMTAYQKNKEVFVLQLHTSFTIE